MTKKNRNVSITTSVNISQLAQEISNLDHDVIKEFIKELDGLAADYKFTKSLRDYFIKEIENEDAVTIGDDRI